MRHLRWCFYTVLGLCLIVVFLYGFLHRIQTGLHAQIVHSFLAHGATDVNTYSGFHKENGLIEDGVENTGYQTFIERSIQCLWHCFHFYALALVVDSIIPGIVVHSTGRTCEGLVTFGIRPEEIELSFNTTTAGGVNQLDANIVRLWFRPSYSEVELDAGFPLIAYRQENSDFTRHIAEGDTVRIHIRPEAVVVFQK